MAKKPNVQLGMLEMLRGKLGEPIAILCMRYWYRGFLVSVSTDLITLSNPFAVEQTGPAGGSTPQREDAIPCDLFINPNVIEIVIQPTWCTAGYEKNTLEEMKKNFGASNL